MYYLIQRRKLMLIYNSFGNISRRWLNLTSILTILQIVTRVSKLLEATGGFEPPNRGFAVPSELSAKVHGRSLLSSNSAKSIRQSLPVTATVHPGWLSVWLSDSLLLSFSEPSRLLRCRPPTFALVPKFPISQSL